jgi:hypothetical protein
VLCKAKVTRPTSLRRVIKSSYHGAAGLSSKRAFLSCNFCASSPYSALRFSAAPLASGAAGAFFFFFTTIDVRSFTGSSCRVGGAVLSSRSSARCASSGAESPPSRSSLGATFNSSTWVTTAGCLSTSHVTWQGKDLRGARTDIP